MRRNNYHSYIQTEKYSEFIANMNQFNPEFNIQI